jgi:hypothetical protein
MHGIEESAKEGSKERKAILERRLELALKNFEHDWQPFVDHFEAEEGRVMENLGAKWGSFKQNMKLVWRSKG